MMMIMMAMMMLALDSGRHTNLAIYPNNARIYGSHTNVSCKLSANTELMVRTYVADFLELRMSNCHTIDRWRCRRYRHVTNELYRQMSRQ